MRKLKYHEKKLLKKQDFYDWKNVDSMKKAEITRKYRLSSRNDYKHYEKIVGYITKMTSLLKKLPENDSFGNRMKEQLLRKLYDSGLINGKETIEKAEKMTVSAFLRRRLLVIMKTLKFVETLKESETFIEHGHVMIGNEIIKDPDYLVSRKMEDHIGWNDRSKIKKKIKEYQNQLDDYDMIL